MGVKKLLRMHRSLHIFSFKSRITLRCFSPSNCKRRSLRSIGWITTSTSGLSAASSKSRSRSAPSFCYRKSLLSCPLLNSLFRLASECRFFSRPMESRPTRATPSILNFDEAEEDVLHFAESEFVSRCGSNISPRK